MPIVPSLIIHISSIFLNNSCNRSTDESKSQFSLHMHISRQNTE